MEAQELRIGNWIYDFGDGEGQVLAIDCDGYVLTSANDIPEPVEALSGIPLTPEWLERAGFEEYFRNESISYHTINIKGSDIQTMDFHLQIWTGKAPVFNINNDNPENDGFLQEIQYVHQLQNLYFSLTGTELEIK